MPWSALQCQKWLIVVHVGQFLKHCVISLLLVGQCFDTAFLQGAACASVSVLRISHRCFIGVLFGQCFAALRSLQNQPISLRGVRGSLAAEWGCMGHSGRPDVRVALQHLKLQLLYARPCAPNW